MIGDNHEVYFDKYCPTCINRGMDEDDPEAPCWDCLDEPVNQDTHRPVLYKKDESIEKKPGGRKR